MVADLLPSLRLFAIEFLQSDPAGQSSQEDVLPVTRTGGTVRRLVFSGALTDLSLDRRGVGSIRVADPTGVLTIRVDSSRFPGLIPDGLAPPVFVSLTAVVDTATSPNGSFPLMLEMLQVSDRAGRDQWILATAADTLDRLEIIRQRLTSSDTDTGSDPADRAIDQYQLTKNALREMAAWIEDAIRHVQSVPSSPEEVRDRILSLIGSCSGPRGVSLEELAGTAAGLGITEPVFTETIRGLVADDEIYQPSSGFVKIL